MPEFLENSNSYHLGIKQDGEPLGDVGLPPWAKVIHCFVYVSVSILLKNTGSRSCSDRVLDTVIYLFIFI